MEENKEKKSNALRILCGIFCLACAAVAVAAIFVLYGVVIANIGGSPDDGENAGLVFGAVLVGIIFAIAMAAVAVTCIISGILVLSNVKNGKGLFVTAAVLSLFDFIAVIAVLFMSGITYEGRGGWFSVFAIPFAVDAVLRIACAVVYSKKKEASDG